jgi:hypothetical protein
MEILGLYAGFSTRDFQLELIKIFFLLDKQKINE